MPTARYSGCAVGSQTSGIQVAGDPSYNSTSFEYDGTNWSSGGAIPAGKDFLMLGGANQDAVIAFGGETSPGALSTTSDNYDGTTWTGGTAMTTGHKNISCGGWGTKTATLAAFGQDNSSRLGTTQEYNVSANTFTAAAWSSSGNVNTTRSQVASGGTNTAGWIAAGTTGSLTNAGEEYDGSSWTSVNAYGASYRLVQGAGPQTSAYAAGGMDASPGPSSIQNAVYEYDGTNWTSGTAYPTGIYGSGAAGTQTAGLNFGGGQPGAYSTTTKEYDGSSWTAGGAMGTGRNYPSGTGVQTAALSCQGNGPPGASTNVTEEYDGSSWTSGGTNLFTVRGSGANGPQTAAIAFGGSVDPGANVITSQYDGTAWATNPSTAQERVFIGYSKGANTVSGTWMATGEAIPGNVAATEEFTSTTSAVAPASTLTTS